MKQIRNVIAQMINISEDEIQEFLGMCYPQKFKKKEKLSIPQKIPQEVFFINSGIIRVSVVDREGNDHSIHFALENQFIADYSCFIRKEAGMYTLQAIEDTEVIIMPRKAIEWGYKNLAEGEKLGRLIAEFYFIYQDERIKNMYVRTAKERYDSINEVFPNIHMRVPQHMIASYLGITAVHLSRLKKEDSSKV